MIFLFDTASIFFYLAPHASNETRVFMSFCQPLDTVTGLNRR